VVVASPSSSTQSRRMSSCRRASGRADVVARGLVVQALPVASDSPQRLYETWTDTAGLCRVMIPHTLRHPSLHLLALCRPLLPAPWLLTRSTQQPVSSLWNVTHLDVLKSRATARCVALASRTVRGEDASATRSGPGRRWNRRPRAPRPAYHRAGLATAARQPLGSSADGADTVPALPQLA
jgi:hypothetical protein